MRIEIENRVGFSEIIKNRVFRHTRPDNIDEIWNGPCPYWEGKKVKDTHLLTLIPKTCKQTAVTISNFLKLINNPKEGNPFSSNHHSHKDPNKYLGDCASLEIEQSYWCLAIKEIAPGSRNKTWNDQIKLKKPQYELPDSLSMIISFYSFFVKNKIMLYDKTVTSCKNILDNDRHYFGYTSHLGIGVGGYAGDISGSKVTNNDCGITFYRKM